MHVEKCGRLWQVHTAHARSFLHHSASSGFILCPVCALLYPSHITEMTYQLRITQEQMTMLSKPAIKSQKGFHACIILHITHDEMQFVSSPTLNYSITRVHLKGTTFSESKHFTFSLKKIAAIMPDIKPRCSKSSNHSDPNSAEAPPVFQHLIPSTCIPTFNTRTLLNSKWLKTSYISRVNVSALLNWNINTSKKQQGLSTEVIFVKWGDGILQFPNSKLYTC